MPRQGGGGRRPTLEGSVLQASVGNIWGVGGLGERVF